VALRCISREWCRQSATCQKCKHSSAGRASLRLRRSKSFNFQKRQSYRVRGLFAQTRCRRFKSDRAVKQLRHSKAGHVSNQRLCLVRHTCRFLGRQSLGIELAVKCSSLHLVHSFREGGRPVRQAKSGRVTAFFVPRSAHRAFRCGKGRPQHPFQCVEAKVTRFCFLPMPLGTAKALR
jgi:hypothetical protein